MEPTLLRCHLSPDARPGVYWPTPKGAYILVHDELHPHEERSVIAHELAHHRRGGGIDRPGMPPTWRAVVAREEQACDRAAAAGLIPLTHLAAWRDQHAALGQGIGAAEIAIHWCVTYRIAKAAMENLARHETAVARRRH